MKFRINRDHFANGLKQVLGVVGSRAALPILSNVLLEAKDGAVLLTTTNLDLGIRCAVQAEVLTPGGLTLPVRKLTSIVNELPGLDVTVELMQGHQAKLTSGTSTFRVVGLPKDDFPPLNTVGAERAWTLTQTDLSAMLASVAYAQSTDESRHIMNGVFFQFEPGKLTLAATDGRRLAVIHREVNSTPEARGSLILPERTVKVLRPLLGSGGEGVKISFNERQVGFDLAVPTGDGAGGLVGSVYLVSKVVEGNYPNYRQVIPQEGDQFVKLNRESLLFAVRRAALVASEKNNSVRLKLEPGKLEVSSSSAEIGEAREETACEYNGPMVQVAFNPQFLMQPLEALPVDEIIFEFKDELSPGVYRTPTGFLCVIMPLRLN